MPDFLTILVGGLALWRVAHMITKERGPFSLFYQFRELVKKVFGPKENSSMTDGVNCPLCASFWLSWVAAWPVSTTPVNYIFTALAMAAVVMFFSKFFAG